MPSDQPRKHHYLPQFYLKGFADQKERLMQCERTGAKLVMTNVGNAASERDYHRFDTTHAVPDEFAAEKFIAQIEAHQAQVLSTVLADPASVTANRVELLGLAQFMFYRVPKVRDMLANATEAALTAAAKVLEKSQAFGDMPESLKQHLGGRSLTEMFRIKPKNWFLVMQMLRLGSERKLYELLYHRNLSLLLAGGFRRFIAGDSAVAIYDRLHGGTSAQAAGFASPTAEFSFPLSSGAMLLISHDAEPGVFKLNDDEVGAFNRRTIVWAERFLFAERFDSLTLRDVVALADRRAGFSSQNLEASDGIYTISRMMPVHPVLLKID